MKHQAFNPYLPSGEYIPDGEPRVFDGRVYVYGSLCEIGGRWYVFGHRQTNWSMFSRQPLAEPVEVLPDGSIPQAEMTSCGLNGAPLDGVGTYEARIACILHSKDGAMHSENSGLAEVRHLHPAITQDEPDFDGWNTDEPRPRQYIANLRDGAVAGFKYFALGAAAEISVVTRGDAGSISVHADPDAAPIAEIPIAAGAEWHPSVAAAFSASGRQALYFIAHTDGAVDLMSFTLK